MTSKTDTKRVEIRPIELWNVLDAMTRYGGSFVQNIAAAWKVADSNNQKRLRDTFGDYYQQYEDMARHDARRKVGAA